MFVQARWLAKNIEWQQRTTWDVYVLGQLTQDFFCCREEYLVLIQLLRCVLIFHLMSDYYLSICLWLDFLCKIFRLEFLCKECLWHHSFSLYYVLVSAFLWNYFLWNCYFLLYIYLSLFHFMHKCGCYYLILNEYKKSISQKILEIFEK